MYACAPVVCASSFATMPLAALVLLPRSEDAFGALWLEFRAAPSGKKNLLAPTALRSRMQPRKPHMASHPCSEMPCGILFSSNRLPANMADETKEPAPRRVEERRVHPRYGFVADAEVVEDASGTRIEARVADLSQQGCYLESDRPFALGTAVRVQITRGGDSFHSPARVVSCSTKGMGFAFAEMTKEQRETLETWLGPLRERDWLLQNRRRSQRVMIKIPVRVSGLSTLGSQFDEETHTVAVNANGALLALSSPILRGQQLHLLNMNTRDAVEVMVAHIRRHQNEKSEVGVAFVLPNAKFWRVAFPARDWRPLTEPDEF